MKLPLALAVLSLSAAMLSRADVVIVQKVDSPMGKSAQMTVKVSGDKVRTDISPEVSAIADTASGQITTIMHTQKAFMVIPAATSKALFSQMSQAMQQAGVSSVPKATGKTDKINGYNAAEYSSSNGVLKASYWMSTDVPNLKAISDALAKFRKGSMADLTKGFSADLSALPGIPVKTEAEINGQKLVTEIVSATVQTVDPSEFQVPADYREIKMPVMPGQPAPAAPQPQ